MHQVLIVVPVYIPPFFTLQCLRTMNNQQIINHIKKESPRLPDEVKLPTAQMFQPIPGLDHQLCWGDQRMGTTISCSQLACLILSMQ